ncbi:MAG: outer membrane protein assembly factor BamD [Actinomycetota bacterium]|nr:outer membrane protein assembly factor BamD [Actinomycetota bacterium]
MYEYSGRHKTGAGSLIIIALFLLSAAGLGYLAYADRGLFWDYLPIASIAAVVLSLIFAIFNLVRKNAIGFLFILFLLASIGGIVFSSLFGPFALNQRAQNSYQEGSYPEAIHSWEALVGHYPSSRYYQTAMGILPMAYYQQGDCINTINYLDKALDLKLLESNLETSNMYTQCHLDLAENYFKQNSYQQAAHHYLATINLYQKLKQDYPDTDEAFVADYKIPELTFKAATCYKQAGDRQKSNEILTSLIDQYPLSEYSESAKEMLFANYINNALQLKQQKEYEAAIEELLRVTELFNSPRDVFRVSHYSQVILSDIPQIQLGKAALQHYDQQEYDKSAYLYQAILEYYPESSLDYMTNLVLSKINVIQNSSYHNLSFTGEATRIYAPEQSKLEVNNTGSHDAVLYLSGPQKIRTEIASNTTLELELMPGVYQSAVEYLSRSSIPLFGNLSFEQDSRYFLDIGF